MTLALQGAEDHTDTDVLLGRDVHVTVSRDGRHDRDFSGLVSRVVILDDSQTRQTSRVVVEPALAALAFTTDSRIFQHASVVSILETVLSAELARYGREVDLSRIWGRDYPERDYCVQYRETHLDFVHRLMEEEGIGYLFECGPDEVERMVLFDTSKALTDVPTMDGGPVAFDHLRGTVTVREPVVSFEQSDASAPPESACETTTGPGVALTSTRASPRRPNPRPASTSDTTTGTGSASRSRRTKRSSRPSWPRRSTRRSPPGSRWIWPRSRVS